ncbi:mannose-1-phosphate guanylyltransferase, partial [Bacillus sp. NTK074B]|nr:mannose-1-phosphate guanylyltransferase [Bacillus sp. NTK074B]
RPETGYGWLELSARPDAGFSPEAMPLSRFVEKPDLATAQVMLDGGRHLWNAGIFLFRADVLIEAFETYQPEILTQVRAALDAAQEDL